MAFKLKHQNKNFPFKHESPFHVDIPGEKKEKLSLKDIPDEKKDIDYDKRIREHVLKKDERGPSKTQQFIGENIQKNIGTKRGKDIKISAPSLRYNTKLGNVNVGGQLSGEYSKEAGLNYTGGLGVSGGSADKGTYDIGYSRGSGGPGRLAGQFSKNIQGGNLRAGFSKVGGGDLDYSLSGDKRLDGGDVGFTYNKQGNLQLRGGRNIKGGRIHGSTTNTGDWNVGAERQINPNLSLRANVGKDKKASIGGTYKGYNLDYNPNDKEAKFRFGKTWNL